MFLSNWLILKIVAAGVTGAIDYPSAADFFMNFDSNNRLYFTGGSKNYVSNLILYKDQTEYPVYSGTVSNVYISDPARYVSYIQLCNETYVTNTVDVNTVVNPEGVFLDTATNIIYGYATSSSWSQGSMGSYVDFNGYGTRMVVGMGLYNSNQGRAAVYHLEDGRWVQKVDLAPTSTSTRFGDSVLMNEDGTRIAVNYYPNSTIKIYEYTNGAWTTTPTSISTTTANGDMDWNTDGTVLVTGEGEAGDAAYIYTRDSGTGNWSLTKTWSNITGLGNGVAINGAGTRVLIGQRNASGSFPNYIGKVYEANYDSGTSTWSSLTEVASNANNGNWPTRIRMDNDGTTAVVLSGTDGYGQILERQSNWSWTSVMDVQGKCSFYSRGSGTISYDGTMVLTGDYSYTPSGSVTSQGRAYLYEYSGGSWSLTKTFENPKTTPLAGDGWGYGTAITKLKDKIAIGMSGDDEYGTDYGSLHVYDLNYSYPTLVEDEYNKLTLNGLTGIKSTRLTLNSNTYSASGSVSNFYVNEAGTYEVSATGTDAYAIINHQVSGPIIANTTDIARYDFTNMTQQKIQASDRQAEDRFGVSVSLSGDYAIIGARLEDTGGSNAGAAYIFKRDSTSGLWSEQTKLTASDRQQDDQYGWSVAIDGNYAIVGSRYEDTRGSNAGAAYIYKYDPSTGSWLEQQKLMASDGQQDDHYGESVSLSGNYAIVGARLEDTGAADAGAVYIYRRDPSTGLWGNEQKIQASDRQGSDHFGESVSISGDYAIIGAYAEDTRGSNAGAAYIFKRDTVTGTWSEQQKLMASDGQQDDQYGYSVSMDGNYAIVGARYEDEGGSNAGAAYIYTRDPSTGLWGSEQKIMASDRQNDDYFGESVSISGDYAIIGAFAEDTGGGDAGAAYIFKRDAITGTWLEQTKLTASDRQGSDHYGYSVAIDGRYIIVGSRLEDTAGTNTGAAYIYEPVPKSSPKLKYDTYNKLTLSNMDTSYSSTLRYGSRAYDIGSLGTIIIHNPGRYEIATTDNENFLTLSSNVTGQTVNQVDLYEYVDVDKTEQKLMASDRQASDEYGTSVSLSGNYAIVGSRYEDTGGSNAGAAYIYTRDPSTGIWGSEQKLTASDRQQDDYFGESVSISGDYAIIGAYAEDTRGSNAGAAYIFKRDTVTGTWSEQQKLLASDGQQDDHYGRSVAIDGNYAIVGARNEDTGAGDAGAAYIYSKLNTITSYTVRITSTQLGTSSTGTGNFDITPSDGAVTLRNWGDSPSAGDLGAPLWDNASGTSLQVYADGTIILAGETLTTYIVGGSPATWYECGSNLGGTSYHVAITIVSRTTSDSEFVWGSEQKIQTSDRQGSDHFGVSVSISGDYVIIGAYAEDTRGSNSGAAYIFKRDSSTGLWLEQQKLMASDGQQDDHYGHSVAIDGNYAIVGARYEDTGGGDAGAAYIYTCDPSTGIWGSQQKIQASDRQGSDHYGWAVSISGDYAIVGSRLEDTGAGDAGAVYIYRRDPSTGLWGNEQKIQASDKQGSDQYGYSVSMDGRSIAVGAPYEDTGGGDAGAVYMYDAQNLLLTIAYDGLNHLVLSNVFPGSYNTLYEGSNVLACATDLVTYPVPKSGISGTFAYSAQSKSSYAYAFSNDVSITDFYKTYQYPPIDGTTSGLTTSATADTWNSWTISGAAFGNGTYRAKWSVATDTGTPYNTFRNNVGSTNQVQTALNPTYPIDITLELPSAKTIRKYRMFPLDHVNPYGLGTEATSGTSVDPTLPGNGGDDATKRPKSWILYGYRTDPENPGWESLDTVTDKPISIYGDIYSIDTPGSYQQYKLSVTANNGGDKLLFGDIQLWGDA
jgi:hypothetical protein